MHQVAPDLEAKVSADGAGSRLGRIGRSHRAPRGLDSIVSLQCHHHDRARGDVTDQRLVEGFAFVDRVMALGQRCVNLYQFQRRDAQPSALKAGDDLSDKPALHSVGLDDDQCVFQLSSSFFIVLQHIQRLAVDAQCILQPAIFHVGVTQYLQCAGVRLLPYISLQV